MTQYTAHLRHLSDTDPARLLAHAYVRYVDDLSEGQHTKEQVFKMYGMQTGYNGASLYEFKQLDGSAQASAAEIKDWYRDHLDAAVGDKLALKGTSNVF